MIKTKEGPKITANNKKVYFIFLWHGAFLALTMAMIDLNTVLPSLISELTSSKIIFGLLYSMILGVPRIFNIIFSHYLSYVKYKKKILISGIYLRAISFLGMAVTTFYYGKNNPSIVVFSFFIWIFLFSISGGFASLSYNEIIGKLTTKGDREKIFAAKQFVASVMAFSGGMIVKYIFSPGNYEFPNNYSILLFIGFIGLIVAAFSFWTIDEKPSVVNEKKMKLTHFIKKVPAILKNDPRFLKFVLIENLSSFSLMVLPFYMVFANDTFNLSSEYVGTFLLFQITGMVLSNLFWGYIGNKRSARYVVRICILIGAAIPILALIAGRLSPEIYKYLFLLVGFVISGRKIGFTPYLLDITPTENRTVYLGIRDSLNILVIILPLIGGVLINLLGYTITFTLVSIVMLTAFFTEKSNKCILLH
ncbi:MAG: MFS transporter [Halanaerobiales bacterium]|nr:MFS transporter [Halanaerobiales bacterium]